jgi:transglutaminase-like putative cysteine protease
MIYEITHITSYYYSNSVSLCHNLAHLAVRSCDWQTPMWSTLEVSSPPAVSHVRTDYFGNLTTFFTIQEPHRYLDVTAKNEVEVRPRNTVLPATTPPWEEAVRMVQNGRDPELLDACQYVFDSEYVQRDPVLAGYAASSFPPGRPLLEAVLDLSQRIHTEFRFDPSAQTFDRSVKDMLEIKSGVCQDFAHFAIGCLRSLGLAARYVSGYLLTTPPASLNRLVGADMSHAWLSVFFPGSGWIDVDPTNNLISRDQHITLAWGRDYDDVSPIKGVILGGGKHSISVGVDVVVKSGSSGGGVFGP